MSVQTQLKQIMGQINAIHTMIEDGKPCASVLQQLNAAQNSIASVKRKYIVTTVEQCKNSKDVNNTTSKLLNSMIKYI